MASAAKIVVSDSEKGLAEEIAEEHRCVICHLGKQTPILLHCGHRMCNGCFERLNDSYR